MNEPAYLRVDAADLARLINNHGEALRGIEMAERADAQWSEEVDRLRTSYSSLRRALHEAFGYDQPDLPMTDAKIVDLVRDMAAVIRTPDIHLPRGTTIVGHEQVAAIDRIMTALHAVPPPAPASKIMPLGKSFARGGLVTDKWTSVHLDVVKDGQRLPNDQRLPDWRPGNWAQVIVDGVGQKVMILRAESAGRYLVRHENGSEQVFNYLQLEPIVPVTGFNPNPEIVWAAPDETAFPDSGDGGPPTEAMPPVVADVQDLTEEALRDTLLLVGRTVPLDVIATWTMDMRHQAFTWAGSVHLSASDNEDVVVPPEPEFIAVAEAGQQVATND